MNEELYQDGVYERSPAERLSWELEEAVDEYRRLVERLEKKVREDAERILETDDETE